MAVRVLPLGAGQHVGRSCVLVEVSGKHVLFDCGVSPGAKTDDEHFPEVDQCKVQGRPLLEVLDAVVISHYHLDHVGALPYFTEVLGYSGPLLMTHPTRAIAPLICYDYLRLEKRRRKYKLRYSEDDVGECFERATCMQLHEKVTLDGLSITPYYAGHVLGAAMILLEHRGKSLLYTGDFTMVGEHYLSAAKVPIALRPDVMITEATCCTTVRSSKRAKEHDFCRKIQQTLESGGKVLIPIPSIGRGQEICLACDRHWERTGLTFPMHIIGGGMAEQGLNFFRLFASWSSELVRKTEEPFKFKHVRMCDLEDVLNLDTPMVVFAGPSMLQGGASLDLFKKWAPEKRNLVSFAGYCLPGTVGHFVQAKVSRVQIDKSTAVDVRCSIDYLSHSDHTDSRGILQLISQVLPRQVVLVHGTDKMMQLFRPIVERRLGVPCVAPAVGENAHVIAEEVAEEVLVSPELVRSSRLIPVPPVPSNSFLEPVVCVCPPTAEFAGLFVKRKKPDGASSFEVVAKSVRGVESAGLRVHKLRYSVEVKPTDLAVLRNVWRGLEHEVVSSGQGYDWAPSEPPWVDASLVAVAPGAFTLRLQTGAKWSLRRTTSGLWAGSVDWTDEDERSIPGFALWVDSQFA